MEWVTPGGDLLDALLPHTHQVILEGSALYSADYSVDHSTDHSGYGPAGRSWLGDPNRRATQLWAIHIEPL